MIVEVLRFLTDQINASIEAGGPVVELGNISVYNDGDEFAENLQNKILLSIINVEEDTVVRQVAHYRKEGGEILYANPPVYLNLTLMFASTHTDYESTLIALEEVVLFFQRNRFFSTEASPSLEQYNALHDTRIDKITFEMVNLGLEQVHQLWSGLGGHYMPSVIYRMRMLQMDAAVPRGGAPIREISIDARHKKQSS